MPNVAPSDVQQACLELDGCCLTHSACFAAITPAPVWPTACAGWPCPTAGGSAAA